MNFIKNLKIRDKLVLLLLLLLVPLVYFIVQRISYQVEENRELRDTRNSLGVSKKISDLVHEFQHERAQLLSGVVTDTLLFSDTIGQRHKTDAAKKNLLQVLKANDQELDEITELDKMDRFRNQFDKNQLDSEEFRRYSRRLLFRLMDRIDDNAIGLGDATLSREMTSFAYLVEAKVHLGRIRSTLMKAMQGSSMTFSDYATLNSQIDFYQEAYDDFSRFAPAEGMADIEPLLSSPNYKATINLFHKLDTKLELALQGYSEEGLFALFTENVNALKQVEEKQIGRILNHVDQELADRQQALFLLLAILFICIGAAIYLAVYILRLISSSLITLKVAADRVKLGETDIVLDIDSTDEIGEVAESFRGVVNKNIALTEVAQAIGEGNYQISVPVLGKKDVLGLALQDMKNKLQLYTEESNNRSWVLSGISDLNNTMIGVEELKQVCEKSLAFLCNYIGADTGLLYLLEDNGTLNPQAGFGLGHSLNKVPIFRMGEGILGQAVAQDKVKVLDQVATDYLNIRSGLTDITPLQVLILPLVFSKTPVGAIEVCLRQPYTPLQMEFIRSATERMAILLHSLRATLHTQELLYETQNQAEELETQQEELRQLNAELRASEEELKVSQEELQEKNAELEEKAQLLEEQFEALGNKNKSLEDAREAIELKIQQVETVSQYKSDFLANMSHELRTPLNSILILSRLLADNPENNLEDKQEEYARIIHNSGSDLLKLINEVLDLAKIESGQIRLELDNISPKSLELDNTFKELAQNKEVNFVVEYADDLPAEIRTDKLRLEQILKNFLSNAIKFTDPGGEVKLSVYPVREKIAFSAKLLRKEKVCIAFSVTDTGIGISEEKKHVIFEAFQQADTSTTRKFGGTGLGLSISKELAGLLGGEIQLESKPGKGSTFTLYLPASGPKTLEGEKEQSLDPMPSYSKKQAAEHMFSELKKSQNGAGNSKGEFKEVSLLIIEDDRGFNNILADFAKSKKFTVRQAFTGQDGLDIAREAKPQAILLDINLPDMTGWDVLREIREDEDLRDINVHVMSAYDREVMDQQHPQEEYLPKPVTLEMLNTAFSTFANAAHGIETVLIVEDNEVENKAISELLLSRSIKSISAYSAEEAEQLLSRRKIDCIVLDLNLPGMKGNEWLEKIRKNKAWSKLPIIIYSGKDLGEEDEIALKRYANTVIIKNEHSYLRLLDEVQLFLHSVNQRLPQKSDFKMKLHLPEEVLRGKKVLLVDDDVRNVYSLSSLLELHQMNIVVAYDGKEAIRKLQSEENIDLVLMDVMMPEMDGIEATREIRKMYAYKQLPIIALTAKAMKGDKEKCIAAGVSDYITKPVDTDKLLTLLRVWLYEA